MKSKINWANHLYVYFFSFSVLSLNKLGTDLCHQNVFYWLPRQSKESNQNTFCTFFHTIVFCPLLINLLAAAMPYISKHFIRKTMRTWNYFVIIHCIMPLSDRCNKQKKIVYKSLLCKLVWNETCVIAKSIDQFVLSLSKINSAIRSKMTWSAKCVKIPISLRNQTLAMIRIHWVGLI